jgi:hypothetical protein
MCIQIKYDNDVETMSSDFSNQYDELYQFGARNIINNKIIRKSMNICTSLY